MKVPLTEIDCVRWRASETKNSCTFRMNERHHRQTVLKCFRVASILHVQFSNVKSNVHRSDIDPAPRHVVSQETKQSN